MRTEPLARAIAAALLSVGIGACGGGGGGASGTPPVAPAPVPVPVPVPPEPAPTVPVITTQPAHQAAAVGKSATFGVGATVSPGTAYQWTRNGVDIAGANSATLTVPSVTYTDNAAVYRVTLKNAAGTIASTRATLTVTSPGIMPFLGREVIPPGEPPVMAPESGALFGYGQQIDFSPDSLAIDQAGNLLIGDKTGVRRARSTGEVITLATNNFIAAPVAAGITGLLSSGSVIGLAVGEGGSTYLAQPDPFNPTTRVLTRISPAGVATRITTPRIAGTDVENLAFVAADKSDNGYFAGLVQSIQPCGFVACTSPSDRLVIFRVTPEGAVSTVFIASPVGLYAVDPALAFQPTGLAVGPDNVLYLVDGINGTILKVKQNGQYSILAGVPADGRTSIDGPGNRAVFARPTSIAVDPDGNAYVCDRLTSLIRKITAQGVVSTVAGTSYEQGRAFGALPGTLSTCKGLAAASQSTLYVIDRGGVTKVELPK